MSNEQPALIKFGRRGDALIVRVQTTSLMGDDARGVSDVVMDEALKPDAGIAVVALDLSRVTMLNSVAIGALVSLQITIDRHGKSFVLSGVAQPIKELFDATKLSDVFTYRDDV